MKMNKGYGRVAGAMLVTAWWMSAGCATTDTRAASASAIPQAPPDAVAYVSGVT